MQAIATDDYGSLDSLRPVALPLPRPGRHEVRVRVIASSLNPADYKVVLGTMKLLHSRRRPIVVGYDFAGTVEALGTDVTDLREGDEVFGFLPYGPWTARGAFAEHVVARASEVAMKPRTVSHVTAAAAATTGVTTIQALRDLGRLPRGGDVLVTGASGAVGSIAIGIARRMEASVAAVGSGAGLAQARALGASLVLDRTTLALPGDLGQQFDVVFDAAAAFRWSTWRRTIKAGGAFVTTLPSASYAIDKGLSLFARTRVHFIAVKPRRADLELLGSWLESGLNVPIASSIDVKDVPKGLSELMRAGGKISVRVSGGF